MPEASKFFNDRHMDMAECAEQFIKEWIARIESEDGFTRIDVSLSERALLRVKTNVSPSACAVFTSIPY